MTREEGSVDLRSGLLERTAQTTLRATGCSNYTTGRLGSFTTQKHSAQRKYSIAAAAPLTCSAALHQARSCSRTAASPYSLNNASIAIENTNSWQRSRSPCMLASSSQCTEHSSSDAELSGFPAISVYPCSKAATRASKVFTTVTELATNLVSLAISSL